MTRLHIDIEKNIQLFYALNKFPEDNPINVWTHSSLRFCNPWHPPSVCLLSKLIRLKVLWHPGHEYFLVCKWVCKWALKLDLSAKLRVQYVQAKGFSPVWVLTWPCNNQGREKDLPQMSHLQGRVWVRICILRALNEVYPLAQYLQAKLLAIWFVQCNCKCLACPDWVAKDFLHSEHW